MKRVLIISGSLGLGHITRDLAIARELRALNPEVDISWLTYPWMRKILEEAGEKLLPEADGWEDENLLIESSYRYGDFRVSLLEFSFKVLKAYVRHILIFSRVIRGKQFDLVLGDETYELNLFLVMKRGLKNASFVPIVDITGWESLTINPLEKLWVYAINVIVALWFKFWRKGPLIFVGEEEDAPDKRLGFLLPNRRKLMKTILRPVGYVFEFDPAEYADRMWIRKKLGYGEEPLIIGAVGGMAVGGELLELCGKAYPIIRRTIPDIRMVLVCGPRLPAKSVSVPDGVEVREYVPDLYEHLAACDLAVVQGGGTITLELTALRRPFLYFPLEGHFEQQICVADRLARHQAGVKLSYAKTTPEMLAEEIITNMGKEVTWLPIPVDGARKTAQIVNELLT